MEHFYFTYCEKGPQGLRICAGVFSVAQRCWLVTRLSVGISTERALLPSRAPWPPRASSRTHSGDFWNPRVFSTRSPQFPAEVKLATCDLCTLVRFTSVEAEEATPGTPRPEGKTSPPGRGICRSERASPWCGSPLRPGVDTNGKEPSLGRGRPA